MPTKANSFARFAIAGLLQAVVLCTVSNNEAAKQYSQTAVVEVDADLDHDTSGKLKQEAANLGVFKGFENSHIRIKLDQTPSFGINYTGGQGVYIDSVTPNIRPIFVNSSKNYSSGFFRSSIFMADYPKYASADVFSCDDTTTILGGDKRSVCTLSQQLGYENQTWAWPTNHYELNDYTVYELTTFGGLVLTIKTRSTGKSCTAWHRLRPDYYTIEQVGNDIIVFQVEFFSQKSVVFRDC